MYAELIRLRVPEVGIWWDLDLLMARGNTGQGRHQAELHVQGHRAPALCLSLLCCVPWLYILACMKGWWLVPGSFLPPVPASSEKVLWLCSLSFISKLQAHMSSQEIKGSKYIQTFKARWDTVRCTGKDCLQATDGSGEGRGDAECTARSAPGLWAISFKVWFWSWSPARWVEVWFAVSLPSTPLDVWAHGCSREKISVLIDSP